MSTHSVSTAAGGEPDSIVFDPAQASPESCTEAAHDGCILLCTINAKWIHPSLALRLLAANLGDLAPRARILELALRQPLEEKLEAIAAYRPAILALSVSIWNHEASLELLEALKTYWDAGSLPRPAVVLGGPEISWLPPDSTLGKHATWIIHGEGEHVFRELCHAIFEMRCSGRRTLEPSAAILGVEGKTLIARPVDPDSIRTGYSLYTDEDLRRKLTYIESSRGCPFGCDFCLSSLDRRLRNFPLEPFLADLGLLLERGATTLKFLDRSFNVDPERATRILGFALARLRPGSCIHIEMVPTQVPEALMAILERFPEGSLRIEIGIQTFNPEVARIVGRLSNPQLEQQLLDTLRGRTRAIVHADLIAGLPGEDIASFAAGFERLLATKPAEIQLGILKKLPGTPLARHDGAFQMRYASRPPYEVLSTSTMDAQDIAALKNFARFWELIVNRGHFEDLLPRILPEAAGAFARFLSIAEALLARFGRNWGIDRQALRAALEEWLR